MCLQGYLWINFVAALVHFSCHTLVVCMIFIVRFFMLYWSCMIFHIFIMMVCIHIRRAQYAHKRGVFIFNKASFRWFLYYKFILISDTNGCLFHSLFYVIINFHIFLEIYITCLYQQPSFSLSYKFLEHVKHNNNPSTSLWHITQEIFNYIIISYFL